MPKPAVFCNYQETNSNFECNKFSEKVHKPSLGVNVNYFKLNVCTASIWVPWSPSNPKISHDAPMSNRSIQIHKICVKKLHVCIDSTVRGL